MTTPSSPHGAKALREPDPVGRREHAPVPQLSAQEIAALSKAREARWRPGLADGPLHSEIFADTRDGSGVGLALALARDALEVTAAQRALDPLAEGEDRRQVLWVQDRRAVQLTGRPYVHGLPPDLRERIVHVEAASPQDMLFALEEGLKCRDLACVIGEITGNPRALDFTASRRLSLTAERHGVALWLVRLEADADLSSARMRWRARPAPSIARRWNAQAPGDASWQAELFRARTHAPGEWTLYDKGGKLAVTPPAIASGQDLHRSSPRALGRTRACGQMVGTALALAAFETPPLRPATPAGVNG
ncbi:recA-like protein [Erythrobacter sp.]|jgi:protein ImuA|uniref:recA-like protein n=1 Tax=Erythrobacter sp. TaxID=1042 RepID=UPI002EC10527|nr:recA-like protein [Erythrobacter sp.]